MAKSKEDYIALYPLDWSENKLQDFRQQLLAWYDKEGRSYLPWRQTKDPYAIWVSEIMLQQTQVNTVIPYFQEFMELLPTVKDLAEADETTLMRVWQGLGYYSRVRNMQTAAQTIMKDYGGQIPKSKDKLLDLKGIGPYTAGAIASMAFDQIEPALDGNLIRIVTRLFEIDLDVSKQRTKDILQGILYQLIDPNRPGDFNQAMMDLGAMIMTPDNHAIESSPLKNFDMSYQHGTSHLFPNKPKKVKASHHSYFAYFICNQSGQWLMRQHQEGELLKGLYHFPLVESQVIMEAASQEELIGPLLEAFDLDYQLANKLNLSRASAQVKHIFSHRVWHLQVLSLTVEDDFPAPSDWVWVNQEQMGAYPISSLQAKLFKGVSDRGGEDR